MAKAVFQTFFPEQAKSRCHIAGFALQWEFCLEWRACECQPPCHTGPAARHSAGPCCPVPWAALQADFPVFPTFRL